MIFKIGEYTMLDSSLPVHENGAVHPSNLYRMNKEQLHDDWTDANGVVHRNFYGTKINGSFDVVFTSAAQYEAFLAAVDGYDHVYEVTATVTNTGAVENFNAYLTADATMQMDARGNAVIYTVGIEVTQV